MKCPKCELWRFEDGSCGCTYQTSWKTISHVEIGNLWAREREVYAFAKAIEELLMERNA